MKTDWFVVFLVLLVSVAGPRAVHAEAGPLSGKKLIEYGWDVPTLEYVAHNLAAMEARPFDGVIFTLSGGKNVLEPQADPADRFQDDLKVAPRVSWNNFTDNFVLMLSASDQDWFSDEHWELIARRAAQMTRVARLAGCVGVCFDPEPYGTTPWSYLEAGAQGEQNLRGIPSHGARAGRPIHPGHRKRNARAEGAYVLPT